MKRMTKRLAALGLALALCVPLAAAQEPAAPAEPAQILYELGLFKGTGSKADGSPEFSLERSASRAEALVMLIRLLGKDQDALACTQTHPFTDVPAWADRYVAYAYQQGLTKGVGGSLFGGEQEASANMYLTFVLRALGYDDSAADSAYTYSTAVPYAQKLGLVQEDYADGSFLRGDVAQVSLRALSQPENGSDTPLIQSLVRSGAVGISAARRQGFDAPASLVEGQTVTVPIAGLSDWDAGYGPLYSITSEDILAVLPDAWIVTDVVPATNQWAAGHNPLLAEHPVLYGSLVSHVEIGAVLPTMEQSRFDFLAYCDQSKDWNEETGEWRPVVKEPDPLLVQYILDKDLNAIAIYRPGRTAQGLQEDSITLERIYVETAPTLEKFHQQLVDSLAKMDSIEVRVDWDDPQSPWDDGGGMAYTYPVYLDGKEITEDYYLETFVGEREHDFGDGDGPVEIYTVDSALRERQVYLLVSPSMVLESGKEPVPHDLSDEFRNYYGQAWDGSGRLVESHFGARFYEHFVNDPAYLVMVIVRDKAGNVVGYTAK